MLSGSTSRLNAFPARFLAWGWAMLVVILLSAAPTRAQPGTALIGSAFDPATQAVALRPAHKPARVATVSTPRPKKAEDPIKVEVPSLSPTIDCQTIAEPDRSNPQRPNTVACDKAPARLRAHAPRAPPLA
ncbi:MAG: hypothetical protein RLZZ84_2174 [Pseudomonadota bacterium]|jgi:hypothetical protein